MKNNILLFITGIALGAFSIGCALHNTVGTIKVVSNVMIIFGLVWTILFMVVNRKRFSWMFK